MSALPPDADVGRGGTDAPQPTPIDIEAGLARLATAAAPLRNLTARVMQRLRQSLQQDAAARRQQVRAGARDRSRAARHAHPAPHQGATSRSRSTPTTEAP